MNSRSPTNLSQGYTAKILYTTSGSAGAVWLLCLVLSALIPAGTLTVYHWRAIAFIASQLLAFAIVIKNNQLQWQYYLVGLFNGFLIFVNASGINAVSTGLAFQKEAPSKVSLNLKNHVTQKSQASIMPFLFKNELNWWPDIKLTRINEILTHDNQKLRISNQEIQLACEKQKLDLEKSENKTPVRIEKEDSTISKQLSILKDENITLRKEYQILQSTLRLSKPNFKFDSLKNALDNCQREQKEMKVMLDKLQYLRKGIKSDSKIGF